MTPTPEQAIRQARIVALAILGAQVVFLGLVAILVGTSKDDALPHEASRTLLPVALFLFAVLVPIAFLLRRRLLAPAGGARAAAPDLYLKGHIVFFALCEMPTLLFLVVALVQNELVPAAALAVLSIAVQALNLPKNGDLAAA